MIKNPYSALLWLFIFAFVFSADSHATVPDISGSYTGTLSGTENNCGPFPGGPFTGGPNPLNAEAILLNITLIDQNLGVFNGSGTDASGGSISISGQIDNNGDIIGGGFSVTGTDTNTAGTFSPGSKFNGDKFIFNASAADTTTQPGVQICLSINISMTLTKTGGGDLVIIPESTNSATITNSQTLTVQVQGISSDVGGRIGNVLRGNAIGFNFDQTSFRFDGQADGVNAGDELTRGFGAWLSYSRSEFENDFVSLAFEGERNTIVGGIDFSPQDNLIAGVAISYEFSDIDTRVNQGNVETDGFTFIPYFGYMVNDTVSVDGSFGYGRISSDQFRTDPANGDIITSSPDSERLFGAVNLNGIWFHGDWIFGLTAGLLWANNEQEDFTESNGNFVDDQDTVLRQWRVGGNLSYSFDQFEPYVSLRYADDYRMTEIVVAGGQQPSNDSDDFMFATGFRYFNNDNISGHLEYSKRLDREDFEEDNISASLRMDF